MSEASFIDRAVLFEQCDFCGRFVNRYGGCVLKGYVTEEGGVEFGDNVCTACNEVLRDEDE